MWQTVSNIQRLKNTHGPGWYDTGKPFRDAHHNPGIVGNPRSRYQLRHYLNYNHWPNPFGKLQDINQLVCDQEQIIRLQFWGKMAGSFWFQNMFPSPRELERKWLTGSYRCGFVLEAAPLEAELGAESGIRSPFEILWRKGPLVVIRGIINPAITAAYYMWVAGTAFNALSQFQSVILKLATCGLNENLTNFALGDASFPSHGGVGTCTGFDEISDPGHYGNAGIGSVLLLNDDALYRHGSLRKPGQDR